MDAGGQSGHDQQQSSVSPGTRLRTDLPKCVCRIGISGEGCSSTLFDTHGINYSQVCGKIIGYKDRSPDAFGQGTSQTVDGNKIG